jgi:hypothetical protein
MINFLLGLLLLSLIIAIWVKIILPEQKKIKTKELVNNLNLKDIINDLSLDK